MNQPQKHWKILLLGDSCLDEYRIGTVDRISPEAPVPITKIVEQYTLPGMAANVMTNLNNLGVSADFIHNAEKIIKTRYIDKRSGQHLLRVDHEPEVKNWSQFTNNALITYQAIVISDYNKGFLTYDNIEYVVNKFAGPIFIDTKKPNLSKFGRDNVYIKINELEYKNCTSLPKNLIVTLGANGAMLKQHGDEKLFGTNKVEVVDVCGCGDTFLAALSYQYLMTNSIENAIIFANKAASITVQHRGNYAPTLKEIL